MAWCVRARPVVEFGRDLFANEQQTTVEELLGQSPQFVVSLANACVTQQQESVGLVANGYKSRPGDQRHTHDRATGTRPGASPRLSTIERPCCIVVAEKTRPGAAVIVILCS